MQTEMIRSLQSLRGIAAMLIVAHHFGFKSGIVDSFGDFAVAVFMMLSGFVLSLAYNDRVAQGYKIPFRQFMLKRLARIFPLYLLGQLYIIAYYRFHFSPLVMTADLLMIQSWIPSPDFYFSGNAPTWFISDLMFCYLLFIPSITLLNRRPGLFTALFTAGIAAYIACICTVPDSYVVPIVYIFPPMQFPVFVIGMVLAKIFGGLKSHRTPVEANVIITVILVLLIGQMRVFTLGSPRTTLSSYWWVISAVLIVSLTVFDKIPCMAMRFFNLKPLVRLGDISYAVYVFHIPFLYTWNSLCRHFGIEMPLWEDFVIYSIVLIALSILIHRFIEKPLTAKLDSFLKFSKS